MPSLTLSHDVHICGDFDPDLKHSGLYRKIVLAQAHWEPVGRGAEHTAMQAETTGGRRSIVPVCYQAGEAVHIYFGTAQYAISDQITKVELINVNPEAFHPLNRSVVFLPDDEDLQMQWYTDLKGRGYTRISFALDALLVRLASIGTGVNTSLMQARVFFRSNDQVHTATTHRPLHLLRQKLIVFVPGVCGSAIEVQGKEGAWTYPRWSRNWIGEQPVNWLECDTSGGPLHPASDLSLFTQALTLGGFETEQSGDYPGFVTIYGSGAWREWAQEPPRHPTVYACDGARFPHYLIETWPYDWRLRLERAVDALLGGDTRGAYTSPSLAELLRRAREPQKDATGKVTGSALQPLLDDKVALACHSTGGLITRGVLARPEAAALVDRAFFINVPFWGAPKAYDVFLSGEMLPFISTALMRRLADNTPVVYYLSPSERFPDPVLALGDKATRQEVRREAGQDVRAVIARLLEDARKHELYPQPGEDGKAWHGWNATLQDAANAYHSSVAEQPWKGCTVFWSDTRNDDTPGALYVSGWYFIVNPPRSGRSVDWGIHTDPVAGDGTVPLSSQKADCPAERLVRIPSDPDHVAAPSERFVWETIFERLAKLD